MKNDADNKCGVWKDASSHVYECGKCGYLSYIRYPKCPECKTDMKGVEYKPRCKECGSRMIYEDIVYGLSYYNYYKCEKCGRTRIASDEDLCYNNNLEI